MKNRYAPSEVAQIAFKYAEYQLMREKIKTFPGQSNERTECAKKTVDLIYDIPRDVREELNLTRDRLEWLLLEANLLKTSTMGMPVGISRAIARRGEKDD